MTTKCIGSTYKGSTTESFSILSFIDCCNETERTELNRTERNETEIIDRNRATIFLKSTQNASPGLSSRCCPCHCSIELLLSTCRISRRAGLLQWLHYGQVLY
jgi:hypothetical protein